ncbi:MAG: GTP cyclohydrolase II [Dehalococcoidia bacterium]
MQPLAAAGSPAAVTQVADAALPTRFGSFRIAVYLVGENPVESVALTYGDLQADPLPLVRLHSECLTGEALGSLRCDCGEQLETALARIAESRSGMLLYLRQEGRGIGLINKVRAYALQDTGMDTVDANLALGLPVDSREYASAAAILRHMGVTAVRLLTNNPEKSRALEQNGVKVAERVSLQTSANPVNLDYLLTKAGRMGHLLSYAEQAEPADPPATANGRRGHSTTNG